MTYIISPIGKSAEVDNHRMSLFFSQKPQTPFVQNTQSYVFHPCYFFLYLWRGRKMVNMFLQPHQHSVLYSTLSLNLSSAHLTWRVRLVFAAKGFDFPDLN